MLLVNLQSYKNDSSLMMFHDSDDIHGDFLEQRGRELNPVPSSPTFHSENFTLKWTAFPLKANGLNTKRLTLRVLILDAKNASKKPLPPSHRSREIQKQSYGTGKQEVLHSQHQGSGLNPVYTSRGYAGMRNWYEFKALGASDGELAKNLNKVDLDAHVRIARLLLYSFPANKTSSTTDTPRRRFSPSAPRENKGERSSRSVSIPLCCKAAH
uniref:Uncharacterized protein n=1 Tax=Steinernema glaseri TaxID=37863 RepID=A0A1I8ADP8_9BILA